MNIFMKVYVKSKSKEILCRKFSKTTGIEIRSQHWGGNMKLSMEGIVVEYVLHSADPGRNEKNHNFIHIKVMIMDKIYVIHMLIWFISKRTLNHDY